MPLVKCKTCKGKSEVYDKDLQDWVKCPDCKDGLKWIK